MFNWSLSRPFPHCGGLSSARVACLPFGDSYIGQAEHWKNLKC